MLAGMRVIMSKLFFVFSILISTEKFAVSVSVFIFYLCFYTYLSLFLLSNNFLAKNLVDVGSDRDLIWLRCTAAYMQHANAWVI